MRFLLTGAAGFIGSFVAEQIVEAGDDVIGVDSFDDRVYPASLKHERVGRFDGQGRFALHDVDVNDSRFGDLLRDTRPDVVVHLAGLANPRTSARLALGYTAANVAGTVAVLEAMRAAEVGKLVVASSSTVYGSDPHVPWTEDLPCDRPLNPYAASKRAAEHFCHAYHAMDGMSVYALRFFTAYGPWGRPDMMPLAITRALIEGGVITLFDEGRPRRDFTYVGDIADGVVAAARRVDGFEVINLGRGEPVAMRDFVALLEEITGRRAHIETAPLPPTDAPTTCADIAKARRLLEYDPRTPLREGLQRMVRWYVSRDQPVGVGR